MTTSYNHRFARTFHHVSHLNPELPLSARFSLTQMQLRQDRLADLIAELQAYQRPAAAQPGQKSSLG